MLAASHNLSPPQIASSQDCPTERASPACNNGDPIDGYWWFERWVPGYITLDSWFAGSPVHAIGNAVYYAPWRMEATAEFRGLDLTGYEGGVSGLSCADIGLDVWIKRDPARTSWEGPFLIVDCAQRNDMYGALAFRDEVIEVGFETALKWGMVERTANWGWRNLIWRLEEVAVSKLPPEQLSEPPIRLSEWWLDQLEFVTRSEFGEELREGWTRPRYDPNHSWLLKGSTVSFGQPTTTPTASPTSIPSFTSTPTRTNTATIPTSTSTPMQTHRPTALSESTTLPNAGSEPQITKEVMDNKPTTFGVLTILAALFVGLFVTVRDWNRLGGKKR